MTKKPKAKAKPKKRPTCSIFCHGCGKCRPGEIFDIKERVV